MVARVGGRALSQSQLPLLRLVPKNTSQDGAGENAKPKATENRDTDASLSRIMTQGDGTVTQQEQPVELFTIFTNATKLLNFTINTVSQVNHKIFILFEVRTSRVFILNNTLVFIIFQLHVTGEK